jgi:hypothetical protein
MGNNKEIRQRMDTYQGVLLVINWVCSIIGIIVGLVLLSSEIGRYAAIIIIVAIIFGVVGHFLINVALAIPFILLNNGEILTKILRKDKTISFDYVVSRDINLRSEPKIDSKVLTVLKNDDEIEFLEKGEEATFDEITASWFKVKNEDELIGWCFSGYLRKK